MARAEPHEKEVVVRLVDVIDTQVRVGAGDTDCLCPVGGVGGQLSFVFEDDADAQGGVGWRRLVVGGVAADADAGK